MRSPKIFRHIKIFPNFYTNKTVILFVANHYIEPNILNELKSYRVEVVFRGNRASSLPDENIITCPFKNEDVQVYIQVTINKLIESFIDCECHLYKDETLLGKKKLSLGIKLRDKVIHKTKWFLNLCYLNIRSLIKIHKKPVISLHLWHLDIALDMLNAFKATSQHCELRVAFPSNLDVQVLNEFISKVKNIYQFNKISTHEVPPVGRDVGGFISSLIFSLKSSEFKNRPHLFLHTKNTPGLPMFIVKHWRDSLIYDIAFNLNFMISILLFKIFDAALVYSKYNDLIEDGNDHVVERKASYDLARSVEYDLFNQTNREVRFCAGTMMWVLPARIEKVWSTDRLEVVLSKLEPSKTMQEPSYAHAFERAFPDVARNFGLKVFTF
jgi:hypothetical protein